jgi:hypothetical protein
MRPWTAGQKRFSFRTLQMAQDNRFFLGFHYFMAHVSGGRAQNPSSTAETPRTRRKIALGFVAHNCTIPDANLPEADKAR